MLLYNFGNGFTNSKKNCRVSSVFGIDIKYEYIENILMKEQSYITLTTGIIGYVSQMNSERISIYIFPPIKAPSGDMCLYSPDDALIVWIIYIEILFYSRCVLSTMFHVPPSSTNKVQSYIIWLLFRLLWIYLGKSFCLFTYKDVW